MDMEDSAARMLYDDLDAPKSRAPALRRTRARSNSR
jgi:uncharacterized protein (DUF1778 family)